MRALAIAAGLTALAIGAAAQDREPRGDIVRAAAQSVVRVQADACLDGDGGRTGSRAGSGFVWPEIGHVITALHLVADCGRLSVDYVDAGLQRSATLSRSLRRADLALLQVSDPPGAQPLPLGAGLEEQEALAAIGLPLNIRGWQETYGRRTAKPPGPLDDILNARAREEIRRLGVPDLQLEIFRLDAVVKPGSSGGPVINRRGQVVGVVNGGLDGGASALNWAIPARYLADLRDGGEVGPQVSLGPAAQATFSYSQADGAPDQGAGRAALTRVNDDITCGGRSYFKLASRTVEDIVRSLSGLADQGVLDDPAGFVGLVQLFSNIMAPEQIGALRYDLLVDAATGATIAVPWGARLDDYGDGCVAAFTGSDIEIAFGAVSLRSAAEVQPASLEFERRVAQGYGFVGCQSDMNLIEPGPHSRFDGLIGRRQGAYCWDDPSMPPHYAMVAYLSRGASFTGIAAINMDTGRTGPGGDWAVTRDWIAAALAVMLSTYQI